MPELNKDAITFHNAFIIGDREKSLTVETPLKHFDGEPIVVHVSLNHTNFTTECDYMVSDLGQVARHYNDNPQLNSSSMIPGEFLKQFDVEETDDDELLYCFCDRESIGTTVIKLAACICAIEQALIRG